MVGWCRCAGSVVNVDYHQSMRTLTTVETARRLGVKAETVYAYVSRGVLRSMPSADGRSSRFDAAEVEALALRGRPRRVSRRLTFEVEIETHLTEIDGRSLRFRGHDAVGLATTATFEQVAELLWRGVLPTRHSAWTGSPLALPEGGSLGDRLRVAVDLAAIADPSRGDLRPEAVAACGRSMIATIVDSLPLAGEGRAPRLVLRDGVAHRGTIAGRLWARLASVRPRPELVAVLNAALVLMIDHELAASTFAARIAASVRADPYAVVGAGLGPMSGPLHGRASRAARQMLESARQPGGALAATAEVLRTQGRFPGFGHMIYADGDPRARALLDLLRRAEGGSRAMSVVDEVLAAAQRRVPIQPNVDFAVAALGMAAGMPEESGEVVFTVARMAGWLAHAIEEYDEAPVRFRPRANYVPADG
jgi:citrate synthase